MRNTQPRNLKSLKKNRLNEQEYNKYLISLIMCVCVNIMFIYVAFSTHIKSLSKFQSPTFLNEYSFNMIYIKACR